MNPYCLEAAQYIDNTYRYWCYQHAVAENRKMVQIMIFSEQLYFYHSYLIIDIFNLKNNMKCCHLVVRDLMTSLDNEHQPGQADKLIGVLHPKQEGTVVQQQPNTEFNHRTENDDTQSAERLEQIEELQKKIASIHFQHFRIWGTAKPNKMRKVPAEDL